MRKTGTKEWAECNINIARGCEHGCRYCYARHNLVERFKVLTPEEWKTTTVVRNKVDVGYGQKAGVIMMPSSHDIVPGIIDDFCLVLKKLLKKKNNVLLVTKPHYECIRRICEEFGSYTDQILFRFSIGSANDEVLTFWEPNAPSFTERKQSLEYAFCSGFETSVSCEPFLDPNPVKTMLLYRLLENFITETFWVGSLRHWRYSMTNDVPVDQLHKFYYPLQNVCKSKKSIQLLYNMMCDFEKVKWKDSIAEMIESH